MSDDESGRDKFAVSVVTAVVTAILAFVGAVGGSYITADLQRSQWERETGYDFQQDIFRQRLDLIERMSRILNKQSTVELYATLADTNAKLLLTKLDPKEQEQFDKLMNDTTNYNVQVAELNSEFATTISLANIYFGPKTSEAIEDLQPDWPEADRKEGFAVLDAMRDELWYRIEKPPDYSMSQGS